MNLFTSKSKVISSKVEPEAIDLESIYSVEDGDFYN